MSVDAQKTENPADLSVYGYDVAIAELTKRFRPGYRDRIRDAFEHGLALHCAEPIWQEVERQTELVETTRLIRGEATEVTGLTQEESAERVGRTQPTFSKWLRAGEGSAVWSNMALAMTVFGVELNEICLPELNSRFRNGFVSCIQHVRSIEFGESRFVAPRQDTVECLAVQYGGNSPWFRAKKEREVNKRVERLERTAKKMAALADQRCGHKVHIRTRQQFSELEFDWGPSWLVCGYVIKVCWEDRHESHATRADHVSHCP